MGLNLTLLILGLGSGSIIALTALGLVLMYRSSGVINFATGGVGMASSYIMWDLTRQSGWPTWIAGVAAVAAGAVVGLVTYVLVMLLPRASSALTRVVGTLAVLIILEASAQLRYGPNALAVDKYLPTGSVDFGGGVVIQTNRLVLLAVAVVLALGLALVYTRTSFGLATTAVSEHPRKLAALGWRINVVGAVNWALGGALAGLAGVLLAPITGVDVGNGHTLTVTVLAAALIGGLRSFPLTLAGGMAIGMMQSLFGIHDLGIPHLADAVPFVVIIAVLAFRGRSLPARSFIGDRLPHVGGGHVSVPVVAAAVVVSLVLIGPVLNDNGTTALTTTLLAAIPLLSLTMLLGYAGQMSLAQLTLSGVGGLVAARLAASTGLPFPIVFVVAALATVPVGLVVGLPSARTRGVSLAVATLGLAVAIQALVFNNDSISGGRNGIALADDASFHVFGADFTSLVHTDRFAVLVLGVLVVVAVLVANLRRSASGRRFIAVRGNERASAALGINVVGTKLWAFGIASAIAGMGGVLVAYRGSVALFTQYSVLSNINAIANSVVGGAGGVLGALFGSTLETSGLGNAALSKVIGVGPVTMGLIGGVLLIVTIIGSPDGMAASAAQAFGRLRPKRASASDPNFGYLERVALVPHRVEERPLTVRAVQVSFGGIPVLRGIDLHVAPGEVVGVVGANGAGKTTLIDAITGFVRGEGAIELGPVDLSGLSPHDRARSGLGRSWQTLELIEDLSVLDNLRIAADRPSRWGVLVDLVRPQRGAPTGAMRNAIDTLGLGDVLGRMPRELSTGQRKLVALARAIAVEPSVLLLDEPCSGLDQHERDEVSVVIRSLAQSWGMGVLLVEHDIHLVRRVSDRIVALDFGAVIARGAPDEVLTDPLVMAAFLGEADVSERGR